MRSKKVLMYSLVLILNLGCSTKDNSEINSNKDTSEVFSAEANGGKNRIKLSWILKPDPEVTNVIVSWNNKTNSVELDVDEGAVTDTMEVIIKNIEEGVNTFSVSTSDGVNTPVFQAEVSGTVYGDTYVNQLSPGGIKSVLVNKGTALIDWKFRTLEVVGVELEYVDEMGVIQEIFVHSNIDTTLLEDFGANTHFKYKTLYLPDQALDTLVTDFTSSKDIIRYRSPLTKKIVYNAGLVDTVLSDTLIEVQEGLEQTNLRYEGENGALTAMYIMAVDLTTSNIAIKAGTPFNEPDYTLQTVSEIAEYADEAGNEVLAAINADFFINNKPQGVVVQNGVAIKSVSREDAGFFGILNGKIPVIGSYSRFLQSQEHIEQALGAFHILVEDGEKVRQGDLSVEPRSMVGFTDDHTVYFIVVDGRQSGYSGGMSFSQGSQIMLALGVKEAINMDGGGSSALVVKDSVKDVWEVQNKPSDGTERAVANAWTIVSLE